MTWKPLHPNFTPASLGAIPAYLSVNDPRPAREQFDAHYAFAGGGRRIRASTWSMASCIPTGLTIPRMARRTSPSSPSPNVASGTR